MCREKDGECRRVRERKKSYLSKRPRKCVAISTFFFFSKKCISLTVYFFPQCARCRERNAINCALWRAAKSTRKTASRKLFCRGALETVSVTATSKNCFAMRKHSISYITSPSWALATKYYIKNSPACLAPENKPRLPRHCNNSIYVQWNREI